MRERLETHAAVRLRPHADGNGTWEVLNLSDKTSRTVSDQVAMLLIAFMGGNTADDAVNELAERNVGTALDAELTIRALMDARLVVSESTPPASHVWAGDVLASWSRYGWS